MESTIDPSKVKAGDTVTLERDTALARDIVERIDPYPQGGYSIVLTETTPAYLTVTGWTITDHEPSAPKWEPGTSGTATISTCETSGSTTCQHGMWFRRRGDDKPLMFMTDFGSSWASHMVASFVPDDVEPLKEGSAALEVLEYEPGTVYEITTHDGDTMRAWCHSALDPDSWTAEECVTFVNRDGDEFLPRELKSATPRASVAETLRADLDEARTQVSDLTGRNAALEALVQEQKRGLRARDTWIEDQAADI